MQLDSFAQYGIAALALALVGYIVGLFTMKRNSDDVVSEIRQLVENNTKALEKLTEFMQSIMVSQARQEAKIDELLERARRCANE